MDAMYWCWVEQPPRDERRSRQAVSHYCYGPELTLRASRLVDGLGRCG
jgi:hypothetical protein